MSQVNTQLAYVLHKRQYSESSQILEVFTRDHGRLALMSRGSRGAKSKIAGNLQLFSPLLLNWQGKGSMPNLRSVERADIPPPKLSYKSLLSAMYINELLMYLLHRNDVYETVFEHYHETLYALENAEKIEIELRKFEIKFIQLLGFGLLLDKEVDTGTAISSDREYQYIVEHGLVVFQGLNQTKNVPSIPVLQGETVFALVNESYDELAQDQEKLQQLKRLMRYVIGHHLGGKVLKSRELFSQPGALR